jgi:hypothetical protein
VTREDIRKLIGGYATGSLTEAERTLLFEAALDDQELFEELAREQGLKDVLEQPGAKQRLIRALEKPERVWWRRPALVWPAAAMVAVAMAAVGWKMSKPAAPVQVARVQIAMDRPSAAPAPVIDQTQAASRRDYDQPPEVAKKKSAPPADVPAIDKEKDEKRSEPLNKVQEAASAAPISERAQKDAAQAQVAVQSTPFADSGQRNQAVQGGIAQRQNFGPLAAAKAPPPFAFDYVLAPNVDPDELILTFAADGYLSIHFSPGLDTIVGSRVTAGSTRREHIPNNATEAAIVFSSAPQATSGGVSLVRETKTGTVIDPSGTRIELLLKFY